MKKGMKISICFVLLASLFMASCQNEENETNQEEEQALSKAAPLTGLMHRVASVSTSHDDAIDSTSCVTVKLPFTVFVKQAELAVQYQTIVTSNDELETVIDLVESFDHPDDDCTLIFPVTVVFGNGQEQVVSSQEELNLIKAGCVPIPPNQSGTDCISLVYPITIFGYDSNFQVAETYTIHNDAELLLLILNLDDADYFAVQYPVTLQNANGQNISVGNNDEFKDAIEDAISNCQVVDPECGNPNILTDSLVVYIPFANEVKNLTSRGITGITGNYHYVTDRNNSPNAAISLDDGSNNALNSVDVQLTNANDDIMKYGNFTFSIWVKRQDNSGANPAEQIISNFSFSLFMGNTTTSTTMGPMMVWGNNADDIVYDPSWITQGLGNDTENWHHLVVSYDTASNLIRLYRNGVLRATHSPNGMSETIPRLTFGNRYKGYLDDIRVYNKRLTDAEVQQLYQLDGDINNCMN